MKMTEYRCPVCGMDSHDLKIVSTSFGISYHLCSKQCLENFQKHPKLYLRIAQTNKSSKATVKYRKLRLQQMLSEKEAETLKQTLNGMMGVQEVQVQGNVIAVRYQLLEVNCQQLETKLEQQGFACCSSFMARLHRGWIRYMEGNELDALSQPTAACCNKPPVKH